MRKLKIYKNYKIHLIVLHLQGLICFFLLFFFSSRTLAQGNLLIMPKRVVFEGSKRSEDISLANIGKDTATYVISFVQFRMREDGGFEKILEPDSAQNFSDKYLRFYPRTVTLAPNEAQTVKIQVTKKDQLFPGEYRSHLYFRAIPKLPPLGEQEPPKDSTTISIKLVPVFGISIPMIIRVGESNSNVSFAAATFKMEKDTIPSLKLTFNRAGNMSVYGDVSVDYTSLQGKVTHVGAVKGLAVYTPNTFRRFNLDLDKIPGVDYHKGKLHITFLDQSPKAVVLAESEIILN